MKLDIKLVVVSIIGLVASGVLYYQAESFQLRDHLQAERLVQPRTHYPLKNETYLVEQQAGLYSIDMTVPVTANPWVNDRIVGYRDGLVRDLRTSLEHMADDDNAEQQPIAPHSLEMDYKLHRSVTMDTYTIELNGYIHTGGAHGLPVVYTWTYKEGVTQDISLESLFADPEEALVEISNLAIGEIRQIVGEEADEEWVVDGAGQDWLNFDLYIMGDDGITLLFPPYQVAAYVYGTVEVELSFEQLQHLMK